MVCICAWCERFLGMKPGDPSVLTHGICDSCIARQTWEDDPPTLVVSRDREHLVPILERVLQGTPEIRIVVERRQDRRAGRKGKAGERRRRTELTVV